MSLAPTLGLVGRSEVLTSIPRYAWIYPSVKYLGNIKGVQLDGSLKKQGNVHNSKMDPYEIHLIQGAHWVVPLLCSSDHKHHHLFCRRYRYLFPEKPLTIAKKKGTSEFNIFPQK